MIGKNKFTKSVIIIIHNKLLRVIGLLNLIMIFGVIALCVINYSYNNKIQASMNEIQTSKQLEQSLKAVAQPAEIAQVQQDETSILTKKSFAKYEEVIPFVAILENLFSAIDHYADYTASLKMDSDKKLLFFQVFDELYNSQFITDVIDFSISYSPESESNPSELNRAEIIIRLYLN
jgi:hypothetical protein